MANYWGYRIDKSNRLFFYDEIKKNRLRQGWGYDERQDLRKSDVDPSSKRNLPIFNKVKKGDYLLIPHIEAWDEIVIARATEDFDKGYKFEISKEHSDYGHIFPVEYVKRFSKQNINVDGCIRETFKCRSRFWNINKCKENIENILKIEEANLIENADFGDRFRRNVEAAFDEDAFATNVYKQLNNSTQAYEWEHVLCEGFKRIFPDSYSIQTTANLEENKHGADILIKIPGILDTTYVIAVQVKDYDSAVGEKAVTQICKADNYFQEDDGEILIDKYLIVTKASAEENAQLKDIAKNKNVKVLLAKDVQKLLADMGKAFLGEMVYERD